MKYIDLHCDALSREGVAVVNGQSLHQGGCLLQCFAAFVPEREGRFDCACRQIDLFERICSEQSFHAVRSAFELRPDAVNALLCVEGGGAIEGDICKLDYLYRRGVRMMTLTWNQKNEIGAPNFKDYKRRDVVHSAREREMGLTTFGFQTLLRMKELKMLVDVSHGSDKLFDEVASFSKKSGVPFVASHSDANEAYPCARNLTRAQIRKIAECGGVIGLNFCADFLSADASFEGQREGIIAHTRSILHCGGEDVLAIGSDFDGTVPNAYIPNPSKVPRLLELLESIYGERIAQKIAADNFLRIFKEVCQ